MNTITDFYDEYITFSSGYALTGGVLIALSLLMTIIRCVYITKHTPTITKTTWIQNLLILTGLMSWGILIYLCFALGLISEDGTNPMWITQVICAVAISASTIIKIIKTEENSIIKKAIKSILFSAPFIAYAVSGIWLLQWASEAVVGIATGDLRLKIGFAFIIIIGFVFIEASDIWEENSILRKLLAKIMPERRKDANLTTVERKAEKLSGRLRKYLKK